MRSVEVGILRRGDKLVKNIQIGVFLEEELSSIMERNPELFINEAKEYAVSRNIFLVPGLYIKNGFLCLCLLDNNGKVLGEQKATHLNSKWFGGLKRASGINLIDTAYGKIFLCVDVDIYKPEVIRIAALSGADIVIGSQFIGREDYNEEMILAGPWQEAQQNCLFMLASSNHGGNIIAPCNATEDSTGFLARGNHLDSIYSSLDFEKRKAAYMAFPVFNSLNIKLYKRHIKELCE